MIRHYYSILTGNNHRRVCVEEVVCVCAYFAGHVIPFQPPPPSPASAVLVMI